MTGEKFQEDVVMVPDIEACLQDGARALDGNPSVFLFISLLAWCNILLEEAP